MYCGRQRHGFTPYLDGPDTAGRWCGDDRPVHSCKTWLGPLGPGALGGGGRGLAVASRAANIAQSHFSE